MSDDTVRLSCVSENCGTFPMDRALRDKLKRTGETFTCPAGHQQHFTESTEQQLREKIERLEDRLETFEEWEDQLRESKREYRELSNLFRRELLSRVEGVVELGDDDGYLWGCKCGSCARKMFDERNDAEDAYNTHRRQHCERPTETNGAEA